MCWCQQKLKKIDVIFILTKRHRIKFLNTYYYYYLASPLSKLTSTVTLFKYAPTEAKTKAPFAYDWFDCKNKTKKCRVVTYRRRCVLFEVTGRAAK